MYDDNEFDVSSYVHEYLGRWVVARYESGTYYAPIRSDLRRSSSDPHMIFGSLRYVIGNAYHYSRRSDALRRARQLYGASE